MPLRSRRCRCPTAQRMLGTATRSMADEANVDERHRAIRHYIEVLNTLREWHVLLLRSGD
jgi:hypothetical protein